MSAPERALPPGAWDTHAHVFGPFERFALPADRAYDPPLAPYEDYIEMLDRAGFARSVLVHAAANGFDNSATLDAIERSKGRVLGVAVVRPDVTDAELERLAVKGVRALRFTEMGATPGAPRPYSLLFEDLKRMAPRLRALGLHAQIWGKGDFLVAEAPWLVKLGIPIVVDHMGAFDAARGAQDRAFREFLALLGEGRIWVKLTPVRNSQSFPDYPDVRPFHDALLKAASSRLLFGSDWPYIRMNPKPDVGRLIDLLDAWTGDDGLRQQVFVANPDALFEGQ